MTPKGDHGGSYDAELPSGITRAGIKYKYAAYTHHGSRYLYKYYPIVFVASGFRNGGDYSATDGYSNETRCGISHFRAGAVSSDRADIGSRHIQTSVTKKV